MYLHLLMMMIHQSITSLSLQILGNVSGALQLSPEAIGTFGGLYVLAVMIPGLAVAVRRLHDVGKSGWMILICLIPFVGALCLLVLLCMDSQPGANKWGANPKGNATSIVENLAYHAENLAYHDIPNTCPHCKSPNTKKLRECEWCGNRTC
jgi:uncharacterized membrane protein YhaH (DUF805 family)